MALFHILASAPTVNHSEKGHFMVIFDVLLVRDPYQYVSINSKHNTDPMTVYQLVSWHTWTLLSSPEVDPNRYIVASIETLLIYCNALHHFSSCFFSIWCCPWRIHDCCEFFFHLFSCESKLKSILNIINSWRRRRSNTGITQWRRMMLSQLTVMCCTESSTGGTHLEV